ncbi:enamine deaminase RidA [Erwinia sp. OLTSP20]|nr:enamine deaminase RidA [Erwinia sp. OAMSP11]PIJ75608.1 enamine deaminase RidA [Erwinia sp. OLSSP12]PIJ84913.1 enamine deaminase RidA [Erwinia sp. OLCASP19]PIJ86692.1 enamine deaminase RidA [Erwinia sp. OLMTSP26]PIJ88133.1 enamine deaminase RidA [Erwinia sp. OLMDSP33]PIJ94189.1 enamine deaminase RidA [Erwinia sp. OLTSP20]PIJ94471.1 enamine deaminase RidA [Erwinia sp. OLFS4]
MSLTRKIYSSLGEVNSPYVHAVKHNNTLYVSGLTAFGSAAQGEDVIAQAREIFRQLTVIATEEGCNLSALVKVTLYLTQLESLSALRTLLYQQYGDHLPASTLLQFSALFSADLKIEIDAILALD